MVCLTSGAKSTVCTWHSARCCTTCPTVNGGRETGNEYRHRRPRHSRNILGDNVTAEGVRAIVSREEWQRVPRPDEMRLMHPQYGGRRIVLVFCHGPSGEVEVMSIQRLVSPKRYAREASVRSTSLLPDFSIDATVANIACLYNEAGLIATDMLMHWFTTLCSVVKEMECTSRACCRRGAACRVSPVGPGKKLWPSHTNCPSSSVASWAASRTVSWGGNTRRNETGMAI